MTLLDDRPTAPEIDKSRGRRVKAILAGGLVLGIGAAVTLAAWNDSEFAKTTFSVGEFVFQGAVVDGVYADHPSDAGAAELVFDLPAIAANLTPGDVVAAPFAIKLTGTSDADIELSNETVDVGTGLSYTVFETTSFGCGGGSSVIASSAMTAGSASLGSMAPDDERFFCFTVTASSDQTGPGALVQGEDTDALWQFAATSTD